MDLTQDIGDSVEAMRLQRGALLGYGAPVSGVLFSGFLPLWRDLIEDAITEPEAGEEITVETTNPSVYPKLLELARTKEAQRDYLTARFGDISDVPFVSYVDLFLSLISVPPPVSLWILASGFWNDSGVWEDAGIWLDN